MNIKWNRNIAYFSLLSLYQLWLLLLIILLGYKNSFVFLNNINCNAFDIPMFIITHLGDALIATSIITIVYMKKNPEFVIGIIISAIIAGLFGQLLKHTFFDNCNRPISIFSDVHTVMNYKMIHNSFPSGHSIVAAAIGTYSILFANYNKSKQAIIALSVIIISYSRIYVGVHFPVDVLVGTIIGSFGAIIIFKTIQPFINKYFQKMSSKQLKIVVKSFLIIAVISFFAGIYIVTQFMKS